MGAGWPVVTKKRKGREPTHIRNITYFTKLRSSKEEGKSFNFWLVYCWQTVWSGSKTCIQLSGELPLRASFFLSSPHLCIPSRQTYPWRRRLRPPSSLPWRHASALLSGSLVWVERGVGLSPCTKRLGTEAAEGAGCIPMTHWWVGHCATLYSFPHKEFNFFFSQKKGWRWDPSVQRWVLQQALSATAAEGPGRGRGRGQQQVIWKKKLISRMLKVKRKACPRIDFVFASIYEVRLPPSEIDVTSSPPSRRDFIRVANSQILSRAAAANFPILSDIGQPTLKRSFAKGFC